ncbi:MAG: thrombospondin type 3 repeat-containing protein, partial [Pseudomonadota bacterium]
MTLAATGVGDTLEPKALATSCALLDNAARIRRMDGLLQRLAVHCHREDLLGGVTSPQPAAVATQPVPGADRRVNDPEGETGPSKTQSENSIARSEVTGTLCSGFNDAYSGVVTGQGFTGFSRSTDTGATFTDGGAVDASSFGDPAMVWRRADGHFYLSTLHGQGLAVYRSTDDCQTFSLLALAHVGTGDDKELLAVDNHVGSPHYGRLYLVWTDFADGERIYSTYSDNGTTWSTPVALSAAGADVQGAWPMVAPDGTLYVSWVRWNPFFDGPIDIELTVSDNGGVSFSGATNPLTGAVNPYAAGPTALCGRPALNGNIRYLPSPQLAVSPNGDLHVVYSYDPDGRELGDMVDVFYRRSTDRGQSWLPEIRINDDDTLTDQFFPTISAGPTGRIVIGWYDRRLDATDNLAVDYFAAASDDGGATFGPNERLSDESSPIFLDPGLATCYHGDYDGSVQTAASAFFQWSDDRAFRDGFNDPDAYVDRNIYEADFFLTPDPAQMAVCAPDEAVFELTIGEELDFTEPVSLSASGHPDGTSLGFSDNPVVPPATTSLVVGDTASGMPGLFTIEVAGAAVDKVRVADVTLDLALSVPAASTLDAPADGATEVVTRPDFAWTPDPQARAYTVEIASDPEFANIVDVGTSAAPAYTPGTSLGPDTTYYWRVTADNQCGTGATSAVQSFTTRNLICVPVNTAIPDNTPAGLDSTTLLAADGIVSALDVFVDVEHTYVGDVAVTLTHEDTGTSAIIIDRPGWSGSGFGCGGNDILATLDDDAAESVEDQCLTVGVAIEGTFAPNNPLGVFEGEALAGEWTLNVSDNAMIDFGTMKEWCMIPVVSAPPVDTDGDGVTDDLDNCTLAPNAAQRDSNGDGFGNVCDADLDNDCIVNAVDLGLLR